jgi:ribonuclease P protein component
LFAAFCLRVPEQRDGPRIGFTVSRAMGKSVIRNRMKRRMREAVRLNLEHLPPEWSVVFNPRKALLDARFPDIEAEVRKVFSRCENS